MTRGRVGQLTLVTFCLLLPAANAMGQLLPRQVLPKLSIITEPTPPDESRLVVKFLDDLKVRAAGGNLTSLVGADLSAVNTLQVQYGLSFSTLIQLPQATLDSVESAAASQSGIEQPDLAGIMKVAGPQATIEDAASAMLVLNDVEFAYFEVLNPELPSVCDQRLAVCSDPPHALCGTGEDCCDITPQTCNFFAAGCQGYHAPDPGIDMACAWAYGGRGAGITVADAEFSFHAHEDLCNVILDSVPFDPSALAGCSDDEHGTAVLGILVALDNDYGVTGLAPDATARFFTEKPVGGADRAGAITRAIDALSAGDVLLLEMQTNVGSVPGGPAELEPVVFMLTEMAILKKIVVVAAAGNNGTINLDSDNCVGDENIDPVCQAYRASGDSGAIIVGMGTPDATHERLSGSYGSRVNVQSWGDQVFTTSQACSLGNRVGPLDEPPQRYFDAFNGTSSASAIVAGAVTGLQSAAMEGLGRKLLPLEMRTVLFESGISQGPFTVGKPIGPALNMADALFAMGVALDCNTNNYPDLCDIATGVSIDCNGNNVPDDCDIASDPNIDCNGNGIPDACDIVGLGPSGDCNNNDVPDDCDITAGTSKNCNGNLVPDECDIANGFSQDDCTPGSPGTNGIPDECDGICSLSTCDLPFCGDDRSCDIAPVSICPPWGCQCDGTCGFNPPFAGATSCAVSTGNGGQCEGTVCVATICALDTDCSSGYYCDTATGACLNCDTVAPVAEPSPVAKNRYISFVSTNTGKLTALRVTLTSLPAPFASFNGTKMWVGTPAVTCELPGQTGPSCSGSMFWTARLVCDPVYIDWSTYGTIHIYDDEIVPNATYGVQALGHACDPADEIAYSASLAVSTSALWGDVTGSCTAQGQCTPPDGVVDIVDVTAVNDKFQNLASAPSKAWCDLDASIPNRVVDVMDILKVSTAQGGAAYPFGGPTACPPPGGGGLPPGGGQN